MERSTLVATVRSARIRTLVLSADTIGPGSLIQDPLNTPAEYLKAQPNQLTVELRSL
jgi:hypothetical protein